MPKEKTNITNSIIKVAPIAGLILLVPYLAMTFNWQVPEPGGSSSSAVSWSLADFIVMGALLMSAGLTFELGIKKISKGSRRTVWTIALALAFLLIWAELAVGVFGTPFAGS